VGSAFQCLFALSRSELVPIFTVWLDARTVHVGKEQISARIAEVKAEIASRAGAEPKLLAAAE
jgi:hypothetical protein